MKNTHHYTHQLRWLGELEKDTIKNDRKYEVEIEGKEIIEGSADKAFFGDPTKFNPEDLLLAALSACHMMSYLYVCRKHGIKVLSYQDNPLGVLKLNINGSGQFEKVTLKPQIEIVQEGQKELAMELHHEAGKLCFIANSCNFEIKYETQIL